jgi:hypothetical protein
MTERLNESTFRHPLEWPIFFASLAVNIGLMAGAVLLVVYGADWLKDHPLVAGRVKELRALAIAAVFAPPAIAVIRNIRRGFVRGNSVRLSPDQIPLIHELLENHCHRLGIDPLPDLYIGDKVIAPPAQAFSTWRHDFIVLNVRYIERKPEKSRDVLSFLLASEIGRLRLRHATWWYEMLLAYVINIPYLKNPINQVQILSHDRYGANLEPDFLPGLIILASGRRLLKQVTVEGFVNDAKNYGGFWAVLSNFIRLKPHTSYRIQALIKARLLDPDDYTHDDDRVTDANVTDGSATGVGAPDYGRPS